MTREAQHRRLIRELEWDIVHEVLHEDDGWNFERDDVYGSVLRLLCWLG